MALKDWKKDKYEKNRINWKYVGKRGNDFDTHIFIEKRSAGWVYGLFDERESNEFVEGFGTKQRAIEWAKSYMENN